MLSQHFIVIEVCCFYCFCLKFEISKTKLVLPSDPAAKWCWDRAGFPVPKPVWAVENMEQSSFCLLSFWTIAKNLNWNKTMSTISPVCVIPLLCCWSPRFQSWCWMCVQSGSHAGVWKGLAALGLGHYPTLPASGRPAASTSLSPRFPARPHAGPGTVDRNSMRKRLHFQHSNWVSSWFLYISTIHAA